MLSSYACFNGLMWSSESRNLERYLSLITNMARPIKTEQYNFYVNSINAILFNKTLADVLLSDEFSLEKNHEQFWKVLINSSLDINPEKSRDIILYALNNYYQYSLLGINNQVVGFRHDLAYLIAKLLDRFGWHDDQGKHRNNTEENIVEIAQWIFGEGEHENEGVLNILGDEERGVMGLYDLLLFRLMCCIDRGGDIYNLSTALSKHGDSLAPTSGDTAIILISEMREISQAVFRIFKHHFVEQNKNIFNEIDNLTIENVCGKFFDIKLREIEDLEAKLLTLKSNMKSFIIYQLGNTIISTGIGCGYYNFDDKGDNKRINQAINDYLFGFCFNPQQDEKNYRHFMDYLLINFSYSIKFGDLEYIPHINEFTKILNKEYLANYWKEHGDIIKSRDFQSENKRVFTGNYVATYSEDLNTTFKILDEIIKE